MVYSTFDSEKRTAMQIFDQKVVKVNKLRETWLIKMPLNLRCVREELLQD